MARITSISLLLSILLGMSSAMHDGAPGAQACETMTPQHPSPAQTGNSPFRITMSATGTKGEPIDIILMAPSQGPKFRGFFIQVRAVGGSKPVGTFNPGSDPKAKPVTCGGEQNVAMTHIDNTDKEQVKLEWTPPKEAGQYDVFVTFVQTIDTYWVKQMPDQGKITVSSSADAANSGRAGAGPSPGTPTPATAQPGTNTNNNGNGNSSQPPSEAGASTNIPLWSGIGITALALMISLLRFHTVTVLF